MGTGKKGRRKGGSEGTYDVYQQIQRSFPLLNQFRRVVLLPLLLLILAEIALERLLAPGGVDGIRDGREGAARFVFARVSEELYHPSMR